jgi:hypothetical protein
MWASRLASGEQCASRYVDKAGRIIAADGCRKIEPLGIEAESHGLGSEIEKVWLGQHISEPTDASFSFPRLCREKARFKLTRRAVRQLG